MINKVALRQWVLLGAVIAVIFGLCVAVAWFSTAPAPARKQQQKIPTVTLTPDKLDQTHFVSRYGAELTELKDTVKRLENQWSQEKKLRENQGRPKADRTDSETSELANSSSEQPDPDPFNAPVCQGGVCDASLPPGIKPGQPAAGNGSVKSSVKHLKVTRSKDVKSTRATQALHEAPIAQNRTARESARDVIPSGTFAKAVLLNGVDAPTGGQAQGNPMPVLLELTDTAVLPNHFRSDIKRCFVTANATGDLSSERVLIRLDRLSCLDNTGGVVDVKVTGYVAGEDGKTGVRSRVVTRSGAAIANALLVGSLSGLGKAVGLAAQESDTNFAGTVTTRVTNPWRSGLGDGMQDALGRIADYYMKLADKIFPVLELDAGRQVDVVITQSASLAREIR